MAVKNIYIKDKQKWFCEDCLKKFVIVACSKTVMKTVIIWIYDFFGFYDYWPYDWPY